ncbi:MAG: tRNA epoxyqueuosine(34) reductase QueG [Planctomycetes bacterium]|nr:tRNA epoxyqueuosine(34) reductase QueG [Planctomycetota bacterium]
MDDTRGAAGGPDAFGPDIERLTAWIKGEAIRIGFSEAGCCAARASEWWEPFVDWLRAGYAGDMRYLDDRRDAYRHPRSVLDGVRSIVVVTMDYRTDDPASTPIGAGRVSRYAWGSADYHDVMRDRLKRLASAIKGVRPRARVRAVVDSAPIFERELARNAGLGWIGKNTLLIRPRRGSWCFLGTLLLDLELAPDRPFTADHCGTCRACLDACPTRAFVAPHRLDATRCISYLTIEQRGDIPRPLRAQLGDWVFGCDVCQEVCPWNRRSPRASEASMEPQTDRNPIDLPTLFQESTDRLRTRFRKTALWRAGRSGLLRNAAIALGNQLRSAGAVAASNAVPSRPAEPCDRLPAATGTTTSDPDPRRLDQCVDALARGLVDEERLVRTACAWALGRDSDVESRESNETDRGQVEGPAAGAE